MANDIPPCKSDTPGALEAAWRWIGESFLPVGDSVFAQSLPRRFAKPVSDFIRAFHSRSMAWAKGADRFQSDYSVVQNIDRIRSRKQWDRTMEALRCSPSLKIEEGKRLQLSNRLHDLVAKLTQEGHLEEANDLVKSAHAKGVACQSSNEKLAQAYYGQLIKLIQAKDFRGATELGEAISRDANIFQGSYGSLFRSNLRLLSWDLIDGGNKPLAKRVLKILRDSGDEHYRRSAQRELRKLSEGQT